MKNVQLSWSFSDPFKSTATVLYVYILIQKLAPTYTKTYTLQKKILFQVISSVFFYKYLQCNYAFSSCTYCFIKKNINSLPLTLIKCAVCNKTPRP